MYLNHQLKSVLIPLQLIAALSAMDTGVQKKTFRRGMTKLIFPKEEIDDTSRTFSCLNKKVLQEQLKLKQKKKRVEFISMLLDTLSASKSINR